MSQPMKAPLNLPSLPVLPPDVPVGFRDVRHLQALRVPLDLLPDAKGDVAQKHGLRHWARVVEVRLSAWSALAGLNPLDVVCLVVVFLGARQSGKRLGDALEIFDLGSGEEGSTTPIAGHEEGVLVANHDHAIRGQLSA